VSTYFTDVTAKSNSAVFTAGWVNDLRTAGINLEALLTAALGAGSIAPTTFACADNQSSAANITGLLFSSASVRSALIKLQIRRVSTGGGATERVQYGHWVATYNTLAATWTLDSLGASSEDAGVVLSITSGGQVQYTSDDMTGTYDTAASLFTFSAETRA
jgi:hypothetical protein